MNLETKLKEYRRARRKGVDYILQHVNSDGSIGPTDKVFSYYRTPWALASTGEREASLRICEWIRQHQFGANGDFVGVSPRSLVDHYLYANAILIIGAHTLQQFDLSFRGMQYMLGTFRRIL
jgi:hypothetical protein